MYFKIWRSWKPHQEASQIAKGERRQTIQLILVLYGILCIESALATFGLSPQSCAPRHTCTFMYKSFWLLIIKILQLNSTQDTLNKIITLITLIDPVKLFKQILGYHVNTLYFVA